MKKILSLILISVCFVQTGLFAQKTSFNISEFYPVEGSHSFVEFEIKYMGYAKVKGRFADFNGTFRYDPNDLEKTSATFSIDVASIDTDLDFRDRDLKSANWFDVQNYPKITFESTEVKELAEGLEVSGNLTIKDVTKEIKISMDKGSGILKDTRGDSQVIFTGGFVLNRKDYGVEGERWSALREGITAVSEEVSIEVSLLGKQINEENFQNFVRNQESSHGKIYALINDQGVDEALKEFDMMKEDKDSGVRANTLNLAGYMLLKKGLIEQSLRVFKYNTEMFPEVGNVYDSYAEALATSGKLSEAKSFYEIALEKDPDNMNAKEILKHLK